MNDSCCIIYATGEIDVETMRVQLSQHLLLNKSSTSFYESDFLELSIYKNSSFDYTRQCEFPDGFLYFKFILEFNFNDKVVHISTTNFIASTLNWLWGKNISAVASCNYEEQLPYKGGYKELSLPWPK